MKKTFTITADEGLHARLASLLVQQAGKYPNDIYIEYQDEKVTLKSIMLVLGLGIPKGGTLSIIAEGNDDDKILKELEGILVKHSLI